jgi:hypothetical protein
LGDDGGVTGVEVDGSNKGRTQAPRRIFSRMDETNVLKETKEKYTENLDELETKEKRERNYNMAGTSRPQAARKEGGGPEGSGCQLQAHAKRPCRRQLKTILSRKASTWSLSRRRRRWARNETTIDWIPGAQETAAGRPGGEKVKPRQTLGFQNPGIGSAQLGLDQET